MKKFAFLVVAFFLVLLSCSKDEKPVLTISQTSISAPSAGNSTSITLVANNPWSVSGTEWCTVSPSSGQGEGEITVTITVKENTTYDARNHTLTFISKELSQPLLISQESNYGIVLPKNTYELSSDAQQISVEVKANVTYEVSIDADWIKENGTKALTSKTYTFDVDANSTYDSREGVITIKEKNGNNVETIKVKQAQKDAIIISSKEYSLSSDAQTLEVKLQTNVDLEVVIPDDAKTWVSHTETKALSDKTLVFNISKNEAQNERNCELIIRKKDNSISEKIKISQASMIIEEQYEIGQSENLIENIILEVNSSSLSDWESTPISSKYSVQSSLPSWIKLGLSMWTQGVLEFEIEIDRNYETSPRDAEIIITTNKVTKKIGIKQRADTDYYIDEYGINHGKGVLIGKTMWAPVNCGYKAPDGEDKGYPYGKLYQWGRKYGFGYSLEYDSTEPVYDEESYYINIGYTGPMQKEKTNNKVYNVINFDSPTWIWGHTDNSNSSVLTPFPDSSWRNMYNDPCPDGWRVPTSDELYELVQNRSAFPSTINGINGVFCSGPIDYSEASSDEIIFLPAAGYWNDYGKKSSDRAESGCYWSSSFKDSYEDEYCLGISFYFDDYGGVPMHTYENWRQVDGLSIRCVRE